MIFKKLGNTSSSLNYLIIGLLVLIHILRTIRCNKRPLFFNGLLLQHNMDNDCFGLLAKRRKLNQARPKKNKPNR
ncbi:hypothetical protein KFK09_021832 [Dendrobium nobile]|uniref:Uncharacterized protein n=1 Tax=Dendrobium nobile TaxID=94219 RepID=A0A8T3AHM8_DENNO|nr:hypothetical protein KFK09_021832 [Dendrobium nobile]